MYRDGAGQLAADLATGRDPQAWAAAAVLRELRPDVLLLNEIDHDPAGDPVGLFVERYLAADVAVLGPDGLVGVLGAAGNGLTLGPPLRYPYRLSPPVNTGVPSGLDLDADGVVGTPEEAASDAWGFGRYSGQYGLAVLSTRPIGAPRTFQELPWSAMPDSLLYAAGDAGPLYPDEVAARVRLSSKTHADVPVEVGAGLHLLVSHPTPPVFDGPEDRNGRRNHDEVGFWTRYVGAGDTSWIVDDDGVSGGLGGQPWVVMGDLNNDPADGDGRHDAILGLIAAAGRAVDEAPRSAGAASSSARQPEANAAHLGPPALDTIELANRTPGNLRLDYVLPSNALVILNQGVFWPEVSDPRYGLVGDPPFPVSDHRLVWADLAVPCAGRCR
jgi:hypothetical protein